MTSNPVRVICVDKATDNAVSSYPASPLYSSAGSYYDLFLEYTMKTILSFLSVALFSLSLNAQLTVSTTSDLMNDYGGQLRNSVNKKELSIEGDPYIYNDFQFGVVFPKHEDRSFHVNLNVNGYTDLFELKYEDRIYEMPNYAFDSVKVGRHTYIPVSEFKNDLITIYSMEVLNKDNKGKKFHEVLRTNIPSLINRSKFR